MGEGSIEEDGVTLTLALYHQYQYSENAEFGTRGAALPSTEIQQVPFNNLVYFLDLWLLACVVISSYDAISPYQSRLVFWTRDSDCAEPNLP